MTVPGRDPITGEDLDGPREGSKTVLIDAGPLVGFTGASRIRLLNDLLDRMGLDRRIRLLNDLLDRMGLDRVVTWAVETRWTARSRSTRVSRGAGGRTRTARA